MMKKRLDILLFEKGLCESRERAKSIIMEGCVYIDGQKADKPGMPYDENCNVEVRQSRLRYVSRGGLKLEKALSVFKIKLNGLTALDAGASSGGFTDCMLQNGCEKVYAIDVGYGQLDWKIRNDDRVVNMERTNIRYINKDMIKDSIQFFSADVSFISLCTVLPAIRSVIDYNGRGVCLIKPQFEAGKGNVGRNGVVRDAKVRESAIKKVIDFCINSGFSIKGLDYSPVKGPKGNIEYLLYVEKTDNPYILDKINIQCVERKSNEELNGKEK